MIETILEFSSTKFKKQTKLALVNLEKEVEKIQADLKQEIAQREVQIHTQNLPNINYYPSVINLTLKHLIKNGILYNKSTPPIIHISYQQTAESFKLFVKDNGIGIPVKYHEKIFDMFVRLNNQEDFDSSGMGLAFCKKILENNGGNISVESQEGKGSTFIIKLPTEVAKVKQINRRHLTVTS